MKLSEYIERVLECCPEASSVTFEVPLHPYDQNICVVGSGDNKVVFTITKPND